MYGLNILARSSRALSLRLWSAHRRTVCRIAFSAFGLAAGRKETPSERWLKAPVQMEDGGIVPRTAGTPHGWVVNPCLSNLVLHYAFDMWMVMNFPRIP